MDRPRARRPIRRGPSPTDQRPAVGQEPLGGDITLEHVLVAAKRRRAPVTAETAGYLALAVADALVAAPATVLPMHVLINAEGNVALRGARGRGDDLAAERSVRVLLATLLRVAVGSSPALATAARRTNPLGVGGLIEEVEAALIPVNRSAARRAIGRLAREVERAHVQLPERKAAERSSPSGATRNAAKETAPAASRARAPEERREASVASPEPAPVSGSAVFETASVAEAIVAPAPAAEVVVNSAPVAEVIVASAPVAEVIVASAPSPEVIVASAPAAEMVAEPALEVAAADAVSFDIQPDDVTDIDAPVSPVASPVTSTVASTVTSPVTSTVTSPVTSTVTETPWLVVETSDFHDAVLLPTTATPRLATYNPRDGSSALRDAELDVFEGASEELDDDLLTYEPPEAFDDESLDFGTASPPDVGLSFPEEDASSVLAAPRPAAGVSADAEVATPEEAEAAAPEEAEAAAPEEACDTAETADSPADDAPDRVDELLAGFGSASGRSSKDVAGEIKNMLGLAPTPPPPTTASEDDQEPERAEDPPDEPRSAKPLPPIEYARPRNPKLNLLLTFGLLVLAIAAMVTLYILYPALLLGH